MPKLPASLPLVSYAESLCSQARVLLVGDALSGLARHLLERGARLVYVCDRNAARRAEAQARGGDRNIVFGSLDDGPAALRENFFDLVLVENLSLEPEARATLTTIARLMTPRATALVASPNPESTRPLLGAEKAPQLLDYYALYDVVSATLPKVRMLGQVPFVGYAIVDFSAEGEPSPVLDTSLAPARGEEPDYFVALAARENRHLDEYAVVQLTAADVLGERTKPSSAPPPVVAPEPAPQPAAPPPAPPPVAAPAPEPAAVSVSLNKGLEQKLLRQEAWIAELEARATTADERADAAESELDDVRERLGELEQRHERESSALTQERDALKAELERLRQRVNDQDDLIALKDTELAALADDGEATRELERLESQLRERGERVLSLEREVFEAERIGRELLRKLASSGGAASQQIAEQLARAEAELLTLRWSLDLAKRPAHNGVPQS